MEGYAEFKNAHELQISNDQNGNTLGSITSDKILLATGSRPFRPKNIPFDGVRVFDSDSINGLNFLPKSVVITGR